MKYKLIASNLEILAQISNNVQSMCTSQSKSVQQLLKSNWFTHTVVVKNAVQRCYK